jgi:hypothetical protein
MRPYTLNHPNCKVWRASRSLTSILPTGSDVLRHSGGLEIYQERYRGFDYLLCASSNDWHSDWEQVFEMVVVAGYGRLHLDPPEPREKPAPNMTYLFGGPEPRGEGHVICHIDVGDVIQLWGNAYHRLTTRNNVTLLQTKRSNVSRTGPKVFKSRRDQERFFIDLIHHKRATRARKHS